MNKYLIQTPLTILILLLGINCSSSQIEQSTDIAQTSGVYSIETGYTISKVRTAVNQSKTYIIASSYEGTVLGISFDGKIVWKNELSGFMNHDIWAGDIDNDGFDEILAANADGSIYCLDNKGKLLWQFKQNDAPMYSVCVINKNSKAYVVCGGFDNSYYYVSPEGELVS